MRFRALGPLEVTGADGAPLRLGGPKQRALLGVLLVHAGAPVSAERLIDQLWEDDPPPTVATALQVHVSGLRKVLGDRLVTVASGYALRAGEDEVDAHRFEAAVRAARAHLPDRPAQAASGLAAALALWAGEPYGEVPVSADVAAARARLAELRLAATEDRAEAELALGRHTQVAADLAATAAQHPTRERLAGLRMLALYRAGRPAEALRAYQGLCRALADELGVEPGREVAALAQAVERRDPTLDPPSSVPTTASRFIGRRRELDGLERLLGECRLLTVTGPGGAGKTRLALELARHATGDHPDGVHVVELAGSLAGSSVPVRVASVLGVRARPDEPPADALARHLRGSRALLVLDNCEHLTGSAAALCSRLLTACAGLRVLATSREPLGVAGEQVWSLTGLALPGTTDTGPAAAHSDAVRLLADRGAAARRGFGVHSGNVAVAAALCQRLDGLPLAIELAAAQLRTLTLDEVATRLGRRLDLADRRARTTPERHRTMRAAIDWSYHLLEPDEQAAFRALSVFAGGCTVAAAEQVAGLADGYDVLARLVDRSVMVAEPHPDGTRFRMLELVSEYAAERLAETGEAAGRRRRHADWCVELATAAARFGGPDHAEWLRRLSAEEANLRAALAWCLAEGGDPAAALSVASPLWWFWWVRGLMADALEWLRRGLASPDAVPAELRARALRAAAALARNSGDHAAARDLGERCLAEFEGLDDPAGMAAALNGLCITTHAQRDFAASLRYGERSRQLAEQAGDERGIAAAQNNMGGSLRALDRREEATALFAEALKRFRAIDDPRGEAAALGNLGVMARRNGDPAQARALALASLALYRDLELPEGQIDQLDAVAGVELDEGRPAAALRLLTVAARERERLGSPLYSPDEIADRDRSVAESRAALAERAAAVTDQAAALPLATAVDRLLTP
jgi:predicted ATPase/DNA-binding SARP family transcriptional activator